MESISTKHERESKTKAKPINESSPRPFSIFCSLPHINLNKWLLCFLGSAKGSHISTVIGYPIKKKAEIISDPD